MVSIGFILPNNSPCVTKDLGNPGLHRLLLNWNGFSGTNEVDKTELDNRSCALLLAVGVNSLKEGGNPEPAGVIVCHPLRVPSFREIQVPAVSPKSRKGVLPYSQSRRTAI